MRILAIAIAPTLLLAGCSSADPASVASTREPPSATATARPTPNTTVLPAIIAVAPTVSPTPIPIYHPPPYTVAIEAGHGGPYWWGGSASDADGDVLLEKDMTLDVALRLESLLSEAGYKAILIRDGDYTLTPFYASNYRGSLITETQARVDAANAAEADIILSIHFNGSSDHSLAGTETYFNPDRVFGAVSYGLAHFVHDAVVRGLDEVGHGAPDRGIRNDSDVGGDPENAHSFLLGTNMSFRPSQMPGIISEALFLSNAEDAAAIADEQTRQRLAQAYREGIDAYFAWLMTPQ